MASRRINTNKNQVSTTIRNDAVREKLLQWQLARGRSTSRPLPWQPRDKTRKTPVTSASSTIQPKCDKVERGNKEKNERGTREIVERKFAVDNRRKMLEEWRERRQSMKISQNSSLASTRIKVQPAKSGNKPVKNFIKMNKENLGNLKDKRKRPSATITKRNTFHASSGYLPFGTPIRLPLKSNDCSLGSCGGKQPSDDFSKELDISKDFTHMNAELCKQLSFADSTTQPTEEGNKEKRPIRKKNIRNTLKNLMTQLSNKGEFAKVSEQLDNLCEDDPEIQKLSDYWVCRVTVARIAGHEAEVSRLLELARRHDAQLKPEFVDLVGMKEGSRSSNIKFVVSPIHQFPRLNVYTMTPVRRSLRLIATPSRATPDNRRCIDSLTQLPDDVKRNTICRTNPALDVWMEMEDCE